MDARTVLLVLTVAAVWNPSPAAAQSWSSNHSAAPSSTYDRYDQPVAPSAPSITAAHTKPRSAKPAQRGPRRRRGRHSRRRTGLQQCEQGRSSSPFTTPGASKLDNYDEFCPRRRFVAMEQHFEQHAARTGMAFSRRGPGRACDRDTSRTARATITAVDGGWTSINAGATAPPLMTPQATPTTSSFGSPTTSTGRSGASVPSATSSETQPLFSPLVDPSRPAATAATSASAATASKTGPPDNWATGWGDNSPASAATIGRGNNTSTSPSGSVRESGLAPLQSPTGTARRAARRRPVAAMTAGPIRITLHSPRSQALGSANGATVTARPATSGSVNNNGDRMAGLNPAASLPINAGFRHRLDRRPES